MNTKLFNALLCYISDKEDKDYLSIWGKKLRARFRGKPSTFTQISTEEAICTKRDYETIKLRVKENEDLDDLQLLCERGIKKYEGTSSFFKHARTVAFVFGLIMANVYVFLKVDHTRDIERKYYEKIMSCKDADCRAKIIATRNEKISDIEANSQKESLVFLLLSSFLGLIILGVISNDNKGQEHLEILSMYLNRLKLERDSIENGE